ncbi:hypothetical protein PLICRDRAFT_48519 [Plicaturopsis crispa FD-325 SS-3]|nr:hypothetical protein PLICRDRAFT_48519 [Plicaturopsis crispa FD-325 SS-3]
MVTEQLDGTIPQLSFEEFQIYLPPLPVDIPIVRANLEASGVIHNKLWRAYDKDPADMEGHEDAVYQRRDTIFEAIIEEGKENPMGRVQTLQFMQYRNQVPVSGHRSNKSRPDAVLRFPGEDYEWRGIGVAEEDKLDDGVDTYDNRCKAVWSMHHIMRDDPTRRFTFAITIENTTMRVWFGCRSFLVVTEGFNWITEVDKVIHIYSSFAFATTTELGWDPTMRYIPNTKPAEYDIDVYTDGNEDPVTYRNAKIIWDSGAESMRGRATRVFASTHPETKAAVAIKDVWRDQDHVSEGANVDMIMDRIAQRGEPFPKFKKYFMEVKQHGDVRIDKQVDDTLQLILRDTLFSLDRPCLRLRKPIQSVHDINESRPMVDSHGVLSATSIRNRSNDVRRRVHYRIVFADVGIPVHQVRSLKDRCQVFIDSLKALDAMYRLGWVHCDISVGNILCVKDASGEITGKLSDLEYIMALDTDDPEHSVRTGTIDYMATEVERMRYCYLPQDYTKVGDLNRSDTWDAYTNKGRRRRRQDPQPLPFQEMPLRHNPIHDVESYWWMMAWSIYMHAPTGSVPTVPPPAGSTTSSTPSWRVGDQLAAAEKMFPGTLGSTHRHDLITNQAKLDSNVLPAKLQPLVPYLAEARDRLMVTYGNAEKTLPAGIDPSAFLHIHREFVEIFEDIMDEAGDIELEYIHKFKDPEVRLVGSGKRKQDGSRSKDPARKRSRNK